jgi:hypothetical protein
MNFRRMARKMSESYLVVQDNKQEISNNQPIFNSQRPSQAVWMHPSVLSIDNMRI